MAIAELNVRIAVTILARIAMTKIVHSFLSKVCMMSFFYGCVII